MKKKIKLSSSQVDAAAFERFHLSKNSLLIPFLVTVFICTVGAAVNAWLFFSSYFKSLSRLDQTPIATITFKYKAAERKFLDRALWTRLVQNSPVYNGDTLHTGDLSEATVHFTDGNQLELSQNTMAQVFLHEDKSFGAELSEGSAVIDSSEAENGMTFSVGGTSVEIQKGASVSAEMDSGSSGAVALRLLEGSANVEGAALKSGEALVMAKDGIKAKPFAVLSPRPDQKILFHQGESAPVVFSWKSPRLENGEDLMLELSDKKDFSNVLRRVYANGLNKLSVDLEGGVWCWRALSVKKGTTEILNQERSAQGRLQALYSPTPALVTPVEGYEYYYRTRNPSVRLIWTESPYASSYQLDISKRNDMKNPVLTQRVSSTASIISTLPAGKYYWQVTPFYSLNKIGLASPSPIQSFAIERRGELNVPRLLTPAENGTLDITQEVGASHFSWKGENEAAMYRVKIYMDGRQSNPLVNLTTEKNYLELMPGKAGVGEGKYYWSVSQIDDEGNESKASEPRMFYARKGKLFVRSIEPPEGYRVGDSFAADMKFTWKQNLPQDFDSILQVSKTPDFSSLVHSAKVGGSSASSISFAVGRYYWRIHARNELGMIFDTPAKSFEVLPQLPAPAVLAPMGKAVVHPDEPFKFNWAEVPEADFYKLTIYKSGDGSIAYEDNLYQAGAEIEMYDDPGFVDRAMYRYELQAKANAVEGKSGRRNGRLAEGNFLLVKIRPVEILSPAKGAVIDGVDAVLKPLAVRWTAVDDPAKSQIVISRVEGRDRQVLLRAPDGISYENGNPKIPYSLSLDLPETFEAGNYELVVYAMTQDGYDISNTDQKNIGRFRITPVAPLDPMAKLEVYPKVMDVEYLLDEKNPRHYTFTWSAVKNATHYLIQVNDKKGRPLSKKIEVDSKTLSYKFDFLALDESVRNRLMNGSFQCSLQAIRKVDIDGDGKVDKILQRSPVKIESFSADIGEPKKARGKKGVKNPYGL